MYNRQSQIYCIKPEGKNPINTLLHRLFLDHEIISILDSIEKIKENFKLSFEYL